jgi:sec-independent protein translocase protein TatB
MFGIAWSELLLIGIVALVVIPPKDLPAAMRTVGKWVGQMRRMAFDFQGQVNSALREAEFDNLKKSVSDLTTLEAMADIREEIESATKPLTMMEGQFREDLSIAPEIKSFPATEPEPINALLPSAESETATPPGHVSWPGAMEDTFVDPGAYEPTPEFPSLETTAVPIETPRLPAHLRGPDPESLPVEASEPIREEDHNAPGVSRVSGVAS